MRLATIAVALLAAAFSGPAAQAPPNVVLILVDDLGWRDLGCQGNAIHETPHIDALAARGVRFTQAYAAAAVCSPTRAAVLTGRSPARTGVTDWIRARFQRGGLGTPEHNPTEYVGGDDRPLQTPPNPYWLPREEITLAELLGEAGYATCHIGKWHLGDDAWYPEHQGFAHNHGGCDYGQPPSYFDPYTNRRLPEGIPTLPPRRRGEYLTDREAAEAVAFIDAHRERPFFLYLAPYAVHTPLQAKPELVRHYREKLGDAAGNPTYAAMVHSVDQMVGAVLAALERGGLGERTLVVVTSDNGGLAGVTDNRPLRAGKGFPYEGGIRVPLLVAWPGTIPAGVVSSLPVTSVDLLPTVLEACGVAPPQRPLDGISLLGHLRSGGAERPAARPLFWHFPHYRMGRRVHPYSVVRDGPWKLIVDREGPSHELYHLGRDPGETDDRAAAEPAVVRRLDALLAAHLEDTGARLPRRNPAWDTLPRVLLLGDSISLGYTPAVREQLRGEAIVLRARTAAGAPENCAGTTRGVAELDRWLAQDGGRFDVIHFNFGLHDLKRVQPTSGRNSNDPADPRQAEPEVYERQLRAIVKRLQRTGAELVFATTTPVPEGGVRPHRDPDDVVAYNAIARRVMDEAGVAINDLYGVAAPRLGELQRPGDVHFTAAGSRALAAQVAAAVRAALAARRR